MHTRSGGVDPGRDGCRVPLPWSGSEPPFGFGPPGAAPPWLPQPADWKDRTVAAQTGDPHSMLGLYRAVIRFMGPRSMLTVVSGVTMSVAVVIVFDRFSSNSEIPLSAFAIFWSLALVISPTKSR